MWSILPVLKDDDFLITPCTSYCFLSKNSAKYEPSCPVTPVIRATFFFIFKYIFFLLH